MPSAKKSARKHRLRISAADGPEEPNSPPRTRSPERPARPHRRDDRGGPEIATAAIWQRLVDEADQRTELVTGGAMAPRVHLHLSCLRVRRADPATH
jgi:hypothetical protein